MTATLEQIHLDPWIIDRAIERNEPLDIVSDGVVVGTVMPKGFAPIAEIADLDAALESRDAGPFVPLEADWKERVIAAAKRRG